MTGAGADPAAIGPAAAAAARAGSLLPREHGAYGQLGAPLATALLLGGLAPAPPLLAGAAVAALLAYEPLLVLLGHRGPRRRRVDGPRARRRLQVLAPLCAVLAGAALLLMPASARPALAVPALLGAALVPFITRRRERSAAGEILAATALSACALPTALAAGRPLAVALASWLVFAAGFALVTITVRALIARGANGLRVCGVTALLLPAGAAVLAARGALPWAAALGLLPLSGPCLWLALRPPPPRRLRAVGWTLTAGSAATALVLALGLG